MIPGATMGGPSRPAVVGGRRERGTPRCLDGGGDDTGKVGLLPDRQLVEHVIREARDVNTAAPAAGCHHCLEHRLEVCLGHARSRLGRRRWALAQRGLRPVWVEERVREQLLHRDPRPGVAVEAAANKVEQVAVVEVRELDRVVGVRDRVHLLDEGKGGERRRAVHHLVEDAAERPDVGGPPHPHRRGPPDVVVSPKDRLWRHVVERPHLILPYDGRCVCLHGLCNPKVKELQLTLDKDEVGRLEVTVHNALLVYRRHRLEHLLPVEPDEVLIELLLARGS
mmetsp:Transcript_3107/g.7331  ORF Transcript_3107/g.7331 Transcript_3107/m.7331 type:complete len:281 (+) Transcript_3107:456-1298(+)